MNTYYIYRYFSDTDKNGVSYRVSDEEMKEYYDDQDGYIFVTEVELPDVPREEVVKAGVKACDSEIADLQMKITIQQEKKQQLLAITYQEDV